MSDERDPNLLTPNEFEAADGVEDWRITCDGVTATFRTASFASGSRFVERIATLDGLEPWLPDVDVRHDTVTVRMLRVADDWYGPTRQSVELARSISSHRRGARPDAGSGRRAGHPLRRGGGRHPEGHGVLAGRARLRVPAGQPGRGPHRPAGTWARRCGSSRSTWRARSATRSTSRAGCPTSWPRHASPPRSPPAGRSCAAFAPMWWTLADPEGNEVDIATTRNRG